MCWYRNNFFDDKFYKRNEKFPDQYFAEGDSALRYYQLAMEEMQKEMERLSARLRELESVHQVSSGDAEATASKWENKNDTKH